MLHLGLDGLNAQGVVGSSLQTWGTATVAPRLDLASTAPLRGLRHADHVNEALRHLHDGLIGLPAAPQSIRCTLGGALLRVWIIDRPSGLRRVRELHARIASEFEQRFGESRDAWRVVCDPLPRWENDLACAVPTVLLDGLQAVFAASGARRWSIVPAWLGAVDAHRRRIRTDEMCVLAHDGARLTTLHESTRRWQAVSCGEAPTTSESIAAFANAEALRRGLPEPRVLACAGISGIETPDTPDGDTQQQITMLDPALEAWTPVLGAGPWRLALCGVVP